MKQNLRNYLNEKSLPEITEFHNAINPDMQLKTLKCKKDVAIDRVIDCAVLVRSKRNRKKFKKASRFLLRFC